MKMMLPVMVKGRGKMPTDVRDSVKGSVAAEPSTTHIPEPLLMYPWGQLARQL